MEGRNISTLPYSLRGTLPCKMERNNQLVGGEFGGGGGKTHIHHRGCHVDFSLPSAEYLHSTVLEGVQCTLTLQIINK